MSSHTLPSHVHSHAASSDARTLGEENRKHYDHHASRMRDLPWLAALGNQIAEELPANISWIGANTGPGTKLLDYACGDGIVSFALSELFPTLRGIDVSPGSVAQYNALARTQHDLPAERALAVVGNLATDPQDAACADLRDFELIVVSMALHHVADPAGLLRALRARLRPDGGVLLVVDWVNYDESRCGVPPLLQPQTEEERAIARTITRLGFREEEVRGAFAQAGLDEFGWRYFTETSEVPEVMGGKQQLFMAKGVRRE